MRVAVVGGGYAGMAAAVTLAHAGVAVTVFEAAQQLGGRARRVSVQGIDLDNGLHILIGAYREALRLIDLLHPAPAQALMRIPLEFTVHRRFRLRAAPLPAPLHLACGLLNATGAPLRERYAAARFMGAMRRRRFALDRDMPVSELLSMHGQGAHLQRYLWAPLCLAALNTPPAVASARIFLNVLRDGLAGSRQAADLVLSRTDLSALFPEPAAQYVVARGGDIRLGERVESLAPDRDSLLVRTKAGVERYPQVICAAAPRGAALLLRGLPPLAPVVEVLTRMRFQPIYSVYLQFAGRVRLPSPLIALGDALTQWVFDREAICGQRGLLAAVLSASGPHQSMTQEALADAVHAELVRELGPLPALQWHRVIAEKRAEEIPCLNGNRWSMTS
jgi:hydroxysqualene dehydroxylase